MRHIKKNTQYYVRYESYYSMIVFANIGNGLLRKSRFLRCHMIISEYFY